MKYRVEITVEGRMKTPLRNYCDASGYDFTLYHDKKKSIPVMHCVVGLEAVKDRIATIERTIDSVRHRVLVDTLQPIDQPVLYYEYRTPIDFQPVTLPANCRVWSAGTVNWIIARSDTHVPGKLSQYGVGKEYAVLLDSNREKNW